MRILSIIGILIVVLIGVGAGMRDDGGKALVENKYISWIPYVARSASVVKVLDLPDSAMLKRKDGKFFDLGYYHTRFWGGEWVGYIGSNTSFVPMTEDSLRALLVVGGIDQMPPIPERPLTIDRVIIYGMVLLFLGSAIYTKFFGGGGTGKPRQAKPTGRVDDEREVDWDSVDAQIQAQAKAIGRSDAKGVVQRSSKVGFGRRRI